MSQKEVIRLKQVSTLFEIEAVFLAAARQPKNMAYYDHSYYGHFVPFSAKERNGHNNDKNLLSEGRLLPEIRDRP